MVGLQQLYNDGKLEHHPGVSCPDPGFSHFRATDIWLTGSDSDQVLTSGVMGRYLNYRVSQLPDRIPNAVMPGSGHPDQFQRIAWAHGTCRLHGYVGHRPG